MQNTIKSKPWLSKYYKPQGNAIWHVPTMISKEEKLMLSWLAEFYVTGDGQIVDLGSFLGGGTVFLSHGLRQNKNVLSNKVYIHCYDAFEVSSNDLHVIDYFFPKWNIKFPKDGNIFPLFKKYTKSFSDLLKINKGRVENIIPQIERIELLFVDIMKSPTSYNHVLLNFIPKLLPGKSILIQQDYLCHNSGPWHAIFMELLGDYFELISDTGINSVIYLNTRRVPESVLQRCIWEKLKREQVLHLLEKAKERWILTMHKEILESQINNYKNNLHVLKYDLN